jgi:hypothetical protein
VRKVLMIVAMSVMGVFALLAGLFVVGETVIDPGGWAALGLVSLWLVPLVALSLLAWWRPGPASWLLGGLALVGLGLLVWSALDPEAWRRFEDVRGPVLAIGLFAVSVPVAVLGWHRPLVAGAELIGLGLAPLVAVAVLAVTGASDEGMVAPQSGLTILVSPLLLVGALFLVAGSVSGTGAPAPPDGTGRGRAPHPPRLA